MRAACAAAGEVLREGFRQPVAIARRKGERDLATVMDDRAEAAALAALRAHFPADAIVSEEAGRSGADEAEWWWVLDPLDGTLNYATRIPLYSVTLALMHGEEPVLGAIYHPEERELYWAVRGEGAWLDDRRLPPLLPHALDEAVVVIGLTAEPAGRVRFTEGGALERLARQVARVRILGAAAHSISRVAEGRLSAYIAEVIFPWDVAAAALILREVGGLATDIHGQPWGPSSTSILAANPALHADLLTLLHGRDRRPGSG